MRQDNPFNVYPYLPSQLNSFKKEIEEAGGFELLMVKKEALKQKNTKQYVFLTHDPEKYRGKYLTGVYKSIMHLYKTDTPYIFWLRMYEKLKSVKVKF